jgi:hypothetical protein
MTNVLFSQIYSFKIDTVQFFKCPSTMTPNEATKEGKLEYGDLKILYYKNWVVDITNKNVTIGSGNTYTIVETASNLEEKWLYVMFLNSNNNLTKLVIWTDDTKKITKVQITTVEQNLLYQRGWFGYAKNLKII